MRSIKTKQWEWEEGKPSSAVWSLRSTSSPAILQTSADHPCWQSLPPSQTQLLSRWIRGSAGSPEWHGVWWDRLMIQRAEIEESQTVRWKRGKKDRSPVQFFLLLSGEQSLSHGWLVLTWGKVGGWVRVGKEISYWKRKREKKKKKN